MPQHALLWDVAEQCKRKAFCWPCCGYCVPEPTGITEGSEGPQDHNRQGLY